MEYTGVPMRPVLRNLDYLVQQGKGILLRVPVIPGVNDSKTDLDLLVDFLGNLNGSVRAVHLLPYHRIGRHKYLTFGIPDPGKSIVEPGAERMEELCRLLGQTGHAIVTGG